MKSTSFVLEDEDPIPADASSLDSPDTLVLAFAPRDVDPDAKSWATLHDAFPNAHVVGCSTAGEIEKDLILEEGIAVAVARFDRTQLRSAVVGIEDPAQSFEAGAALVEKLLAEDLRAVFVLSEGLHVNGSRLIEGMNARAPQGVVITGGLAGDGDRFERTWIIAEGQRRERAIVAIGFYGDALVVGHGSKGGWDRFGTHRQITKSDGNVLYELNDRPALDVYREYLGDLASGLPANALLFPLALCSEDGGDPIVRTILSIDDEAKSMTFAGDLPQGVSVQFMRADFESLIEGASEAARLTSATTAANDTPCASLSIAISCVGRRLVLGERAEEEVESALESLPDATTLVGFYSYGELSPLAAGTCRLHNQTMTLTTFLERAA